MLESVYGEFSIIGINTDSPQYYWRGQKLSEVIEIFANVDSDKIHIKLLVENTTNFDSQYADMMSKNINIKKMR